MGIFSFGKKDDAPRRRGAEAGSTTRRSSQNTRVERRSRRPDRTRDAEAMLLDPTLPEKQRARRRLVGAIALVLAAIVILPMVLDSHPKPVTDDIAIDIPSHPAPKNAARDDEDTQAGVAPDNPAAPEAALGASGLAAANSANSAATPALAQNPQSTKSAQTAPSRPAPAAQAQKPVARSAQLAQSSQATQPAQTAQASKPAQPAAKPAATEASNDGDSDTDSSSNSDTGTPATPPGARFAVQLGAFPDAAAANRWVTKLKAAGVPAYTEQRKETDGSTRTLLRAGPFPDRAAASDAIAKVRGAGLASGSNGNAE
ncbi:DedD protein [Paraburkholderia eburnea]|uniref:DedD protein n=1 Tax=Paraburkholderia eburnea TaxID=1189126 RepID=A0A2S4MJ95_9BURK|nr:SPOR domain-containing protein [Paraburkholderia eburnea]POR54695.1 DedD protein [Paraburkholderia eburnea]PRZ24705.1 DedD protein [Paraburkholderia eburnea]